MYQFWDQSYLEVRLLREYLPVALEKSEKKTYAGFLPYTTTRHSLIDRLRKLEIPGLSGVETGFEQYLDQADRERELETCIKVAENMIDESVCSLYGLTVDDRAIVDEGLQEQE